MKLDPIQTSILRSHVHTGLGMALLGACALWAVMVITETSWGVNPIAQAFASMVERETTLPD